MTEHIYFDADDDRLDGHGWNIVASQGSSIAVRHRTLRAAIAWCQNRNLTYTVGEYGTCDCGAIYNPSSRFDHDADSGQCWNCSSRDPIAMTIDEWTNYLEGR